MSDSFGGTATTSPRTNPAFGGEATVTYGAGDMDPAFGGTATIDLSTALAWLSNSRQTNVSVLIDGEDVTGLLGTVRITDAPDTPGLGCEFELVDERNAALHPDSFSMGGREVQVYVTSRSASGTDTRLVFDGVTESPSNDEAYSPRATYRAIGLGSLWSDAETCLRVPAFSGLRRFDVLRDDAALLGLTLSTTTPGAELTKPWEFVGTKWWDFALRQGELEDIYWRPNVDGSIEGLTWTEIKTAPAVATIRWSNSFPLREDPPSRPTTQYVLSGAALTEEVLDQTTTVYQFDVETETFGRKSGRITKITVVGGVTTQTVDEVYETWPLAGVVAGADEYRLRTRTTVVNTYPTVLLLNGETRYTPALSGRVTTIETYGSAQTHEDDAGANLWTAGTDKQVGTYRLDAEETFGLRQRITETFTYQPDDGSATACQLDQTTVEIEAYYAPLVATVRHQSDGTETTMFRWADGTYRDAETFGTTRETVETWTDSIGEDGPRRVTRTQAITAYFELTAEKSYTYIGGLSTTVSPSESYRYAGVISDAWTESHMNGLGERITSTGDESGTTGYAPSMEKVPDVPRASALVPQYATDAFIVTWTLSDHAYPENIQRDFLEGAETTAEAVTVAKRRMMWGLGTRWTVPMPMIPGLRRWDKVTLIDETRSTGAAGVEAYVLGQTLDLDTTNGWLGAEVILGRPQEL